MHLAPAAASTAVVITAMRKARSPLVLPGVLLAIPAAFHLVLLVGGWSLSDARMHGWMAKPPVSCSPSAALTPFTCAQIVCSCFLELLHTGMGTNMWHELLTDMTSTKFRVVGIASDIMAAVPTG